MSKTTSSEDRKVTTTNQYMYNNPEHLQVTQLKTISSDGKEIITIFHTPMILLP